MTGSGQDEKTGSDALTTAPDVQGGGDARYGETSQHPDVPSGTGVGAATAGAPGEQLGDESTDADALGGTSAGDPLAGVTADDDELPPAKATESGTPAAGSVDSGADGS